MFEEFYMPEFDADYFNSPAFQQAIAAAVQQYSPPPVEPTYYAPEPVAGIGRDYNYYEPDAYYGMPEETYAPAPEQVYTPAVEPMTVEAEPVAGIGSPVITAPAEAPSVIEAAVAAPTAPANTGLQVINANDYSPSDADLQAMKLTRDQWNEAMASLSNMDTKLLNNLSLDMVGKNPDATNNYRVFNAPLSNKGNQTAYNNNSFSVIQDQPIRLVDKATGKVIFQGTGYEAAEKAIELAEGLTKTGGNKAEWEIQTGQFKNPGSGDLVFGDTFKPVASEKANNSILPEVLDILGDAALGFIIGGPIGAAIAAGASAAGVNVSDIAYPIIATAILAPTGFLAVAGAAALGSAVSSTVQGRSLEETLIRAGVTGLTAGVLGGTEIGGEISDAVGGVLRDIGVESQVGNIISGIGGSGTIDAATGEIIVSATSKAAEAALQELAAGTISGAISSTVASSIVDAVQQVVPDYQPSPETQTLLNNVDEAAATAATAAADPTIVVSANPVTTVLTGSNPIVETAAGIAGGFTGVGDVVNSPELQERIAEAKARVEEPKEEIVVTAKPEPVVTPAPAPVPEVSGIGGTIPTFDPNAPIDVVATRPVEQPVEEPVPEVAGIGGPIAPIVVTAPKVVQPPEEPESTGTPGVVDPTTGDIVVSKPQPEAVTKEEPVGPILPTLGIPEVPTPDPALTDPKSTLDKVKDAYDIARAVSPLVPLVAGGGGGGDGVALVPKGGRYEVNPNRSDTFGTRGIANIGFDPFTYGQATGDQPGEYMFFTRNPVTETAAPITTPVANEPAAPAMILPSDNTYAEGGEINDDMASHLMAYHKNGGHTGPGQVKGIGSGQEDKIAAWLSDGEYVWSAQDVADLGDGSTDEGVRRLDKMRHMVRRRAGRKDVKKIAKPQKGIDHMLKAVGGSN
jgi:hypothetical protein